ncbi:MAG: hypothetical protein KAS82_10660 [Bacteroidales bacterium]|nr:hypothetical protein [Bacteroidales bacterium]
MTLNNRCKSSHSVQTILTVLILLTVSFSCRKSDYIIEEVETITDQGGGTGTTTWTSDKDYLISGFVFVNDGQTLTIEAGTVIRGRTGQGSLASGLIVARGGTIIAEGTQINPIIFTAEGDDLEGSVPLEARGLWGGLVILGNATINTPSGEDLIEGIPISEPRGIYGGFDDDDNSGILRYVSIRHGGTNIGEGNEINGLTLGGVGRQTTIEFIEVISNADDGVEFFGGDVNCKNLVVSFCGDDAFDLDQGYHGKGQFWLGINGGSDKCLEVTGGLQPVPALPGSQPVLYNTTLIRNNLSSLATPIHFLQYGGGFLRNSIFLNPGGGVAIRYSDKPGDSWSLFQSGRLALESNILYPGAGPSYAYNFYSDLGEDLTTENQELTDSTISWLTSFEDPGISNLDGYTLLPPTTEFENMAPNPNEWFEKVTYKGAFGSNLWIEGWTLLYESGLIND